MTVGIEPEVAPGRNAPKERTDAESGGDGAQQLRHLGRQALIEQEPHAVSRTGISRSSTARAAYSRHACTSAGVSCGYSATISPVVIPLATSPTTVATGIRVPATQGTPPMIWWSAVTRARSMYSSWAVRLPAVKQARPASRGASLIGAQVPVHAGRAHGMLLQVERCLSVLITQRSQVHVRNSGA